MKVNCLNCGHTFDLDDAYDDYEGQVKCWICGAILEIKAEDGSLKTMSVVRPSSPLAGLQQAS